MGLWPSRQEGTTEEADAEMVHSYKYPPKSGKYFGTHFIMGGEKFETPQPEAYLFGDNSDLNFLSSKPAQCPYALSAPNEPSKTLKSVINIRKDSLRLARLPMEGVASGDAPPNQKFSVEFTFDSDVRCAITIHYFCTEEVTRNGLVYRPREPSLSSETFHFSAGAAQTFSQPAHTLEPARHSAAELAYSADTELYPVVVCCTAQEGDDPRQMHVTTGYVDRLSDGYYMLKPLKQKQYIDGLVFLLQEIYGIENKLVDNKGDDDTEDSGAECVICMSDQRDTLILPCRHLCVCSCCADHLRYQANNCPICRAPFRALLQLRAVQKALPGYQPPAEGMEGVPAGYEPVSLVEALNGPTATDAAGSPPPRSRPLTPRTRPPGSVRRAASTVSRTSGGTGGRDSAVPPVSSASVPPEVRRRVLEGRGRTESEDSVDEGAAVTRSRTPSREKNQQEDGLAGEREEAERRSLLEVPSRPDSPPVVAAVASPTTVAPPRPRVQSDAGSEASDDSDATRNSRLVTVIPIEHKPHLQLEDFHEDTEDDSIEDLCRPDNCSVPPNTAQSASSDPSGGRPRYKHAEVRVVTADSPASSSSDGSTRLLIGGVSSRETDM